MRYFLDWENAKMAYKLKKMHVYEIGKKEWICYVATGTDAAEDDDPIDSYDWVGFGFAETKAIALRRAINNWNLFDKEGILP
jgi:hypothetical protein